MEANNAVLDDDDDAAALSVDGRVEQQQHQHQKKRGRGRRAHSTFWNHFTDDPEPYKAKSALCKHCQCRVNHHKKLEYAMRHLNACHAFGKTMNGIDVDDRPEWYSPSDGRKRRKRFAAGGQQKGLSSTAATASSPAVLRSSSISTPSSMKKTSSSIKRELRRFPKLDAATKDRFDHAMAMHYYVTGTPFNRIEDSHLAAAIKILHPDVELPSEKELGGVLLEKAYSDMKKRVDKHLRSRGNGVCLTTSGWSNINNKERIMQYMATSPSATLFLESVSTTTTTREQQSHDAEWIASDMKRIMASYPSTTFAGAVTENTRANKNAWELLSRDHPSSYFHGCALHGLHLMVKDIFGATKTQTLRDSEPTFPIDYPFEDLFVFAAACKDIVKVFRNAPALKVQLDSEQKLAGVCKLVRPIPRRWGTIKECFESLLTSERILYAIVTANDFCKGTTESQKAERTRIKDLITSDCFVPQLEKSLAILAPIYALIVKYQSGSVPISEVWPDFNALLPEKYEELLVHGRASQAEVDYLIKLSQSRSQFLHGKAHGLAYLLDPRYIGQGLDATFRLDLENMLIETPVDDMTPVAVDDDDDDVRREVLYLQFTAYSISALKEKNANSFRFKMLQKGSKTPLQYWQSDGAAWPELQKIGIKLFTMMATSSSSSTTTSSSSSSSTSSLCKRNLSTMVHQIKLLRNKIMAEPTVEMLVYIKSNHAALSTDDKTRRRCCYEESDVDDDDDDDGRSRNSSSSSMSLSSLPVV